MKRTLPFVIIIGVLAAALLTAWYLKRSTGETSSGRPPDKPVAKSPTGAVKLGADPPHVLGTENAPVMLEEFGDFECPPCGLLHPLLKAMKAEFGARLVIVFREFPMASLHPHAMEAARAAEAAGLQGKFWEMHDVLYENQKTWHEAGDVKSLFEGYATRVSLDLDRFNQDITSAAVNQRILLDRERGAWIGVNSTPTVFLNGREVPFESLGPDKLRVLINAQLSEAK